MKFVSISTPFQYPKKGQEAGWDTHVVQERQRVTMPYFQDFTGSETFRKAQAMKSEIPSITSATAQMDLFLSSEPIAGPIEE